MTPPYETSTATAAAHVSSMTETACDWYRRSSQRHHHHQLNSSLVGNSCPIPTDPWGRTAGVATTTTGIAFVDAALKSKHRTSGSASIVLEVRGDSGSGKTWTLISLAAHHVVATRPWRLNRTPNDINTRNDSSMDTTSTTTTPPPQVFLLDSGLDITPTKLAYAVRSCLLRASNHDANHTPNNNEEDSSSVPFFQRDMQDCLSRIHVAAGVTDWVPVLESIRHAMRSWQPPFQQQPQPPPPPSFGHEQQQPPPPTLLLWDGFLPRAAGIWDDDDVAHMEVLRQVTRLVVPEENDDWNHGGGVALVVATRTRLPPAWERLVTHHIRLEEQQQQQQQQPPKPGHAYMATVHGTRIPFSIRLSGILS